MQSFQKFFSSRRGLLSSRRGLLSSRRGLLSSRRELKNVLWETDFISFEGNVFIGELIGIG